MSPEAERILEVYRSRGLRAGGLVYFNEFGDAVVREAGSVRDEPVREALSELIEGGHLIEYSAGLELTETGDRYLWSEQPKYGARVYLVGGRLLIKQTVLRGTPPEYVVDDHRERHVRLDDDSAIASAVRDAVNGLI